ncbi:MAG TPA: phospholipase, partial [Pirellulales bacterium]|nr:phospholipase [Pirellulales bacterium]
MAVSAEALRELHRIHRQFDDLRERFQRGPKQVAAREANLARLRDELAKIQAESKAARVRSDQKQLLLKSGEDKVASLKGKLNTATSNREYQALKDQIAADEMAGSVLADEILESLEKIDEFERMIAEAQKRLTQAKDELAKVQETVRGESSLLEADIKRLEGVLKEAEAKLPDDFQTDYQRVVKAKGADAMAEVQNGFCGGCYKQLTPNSLAELAMSRAIFCKDCGRIIY